MKINIPMTLDTQRRNTVREQWITQNDTVEFEFNLLQNGQLMEFEGATPSLAVVRPDRVSTVLPGTVEGNTVKFTLGSTETATEGRVTAAVQLYNDDGRVSSMPFSFVVLKDLSAGDSIPSKTERTLIQVVLEDGPGIIERAETAAVDAERVAAQNETHFRGIYDTEAARDAAIPEPLHGDTATVANDSTGISTTYRYVDATLDDTVTESGWTPTDRLNNPSAIRQLNQQLADKLDRGNVSVSDIDKNKGLIDETYLSDTLKAQMAGTTAIGSTPPDASITPLKTTFFKTGKNLFNKDKVKSGYLRDTGVEGVHADYVISDYIAVEPNTNYFVNYAYYYTAFYDETKTLISTLKAGLNQTFTTPANTKYLRFTIFNAYVNTTQLEKGTSGTAYRPFEVKIGSDLVEAKPFSVDEIPRNSITHEKVSFMKRGRNLYNHAESEAGKFVNQTNGTLGTGANYRVSGFVPVKPNTQYFLSQNSNSRVAYYDQNKNFISGASSVSYPITTPANAAFIRFSWWDFGNSELQQFEEGREATTFEPFGYRLANVLGSEESTVEFALPDRLYALVGQEFNIYFDNIMSEKDTKYDFDVVCSVGQHLENRYRLVPTTAGTYPITIKAYQNNVEKAMIASEIKVSSTSVGEGATKRVLVIGDSTTDNGMAITKLNENFSSDVMNVRTLGTRGTSPYNHEGRSGWTTDFYMNTEVRTGTGIVNPFYNPAKSTFDFGYYMTNQGYEGVDYVVINLGINDMFNDSTDGSANAKANEVLTQYQQMINSIKSYNAAIKVGIAVTIPPNYSQDAFGKAYDAGQNRWRYKRNNFLFTKKIISTFDNRESEGIYLIPINANIDTRNNYGFEEVQVNARNPKMISSPTANSAVHPTDSGYWQVADSYWFFLKGQEA